MTNKAYENHEGVKSRSGLIKIYGLERLNASVVSFDNGYHCPELINLDGADGITLLVSQQGERKQISPNSSQGGKEKLFNYLPEKDVFICSVNKELKFYREKVMPDGRVFNEYRINGCTKCTHNEKCFKATVKNKRQKSIQVPIHDLELREQLEIFRQKMETPEVKEEYKKRLATVEPVFGHMTEHRKVERFQVWGQLKAGIEFGIMCIAHNIYKLLNYSKLLIVPRA